MTWRFDRAWWAGASLFAWLVVAPLVCEVAVAATPAAAPVPAAKPKPVKKKPAAKAVARSEDLERDESERVWARARALADDERHAEALEVLQDARSRHPDDTSLQWLEAGVTGASGKHDKSVRLYEEMLSRHPEMARDVRLDLASQRLSAGDPQGALRDLEMKLQESPDDEGAERLRALALAHADRLPESLEAYDILLLVHPDDTELGLDRALVLSWSGQHGRAIEGYRRVLDKDPGDMRARMGIATNENWAGNHRRAETLFEEILRDPEADPEALKGLAYARYWAGRSDLAIEPLERYQTLRPHDPEGAELARMLSREHQRGLTGGYDWSSDSDGLHIFTTTLEYRVAAGATGAFSMLWRRDHVKDGVGTREPYRLGIGYDRVWSERWSSSASLWSLKPGSGQTERGMGQVELTLRSSDRVHFTFGYTKEPVLTRLSLERDVDVRTGAIGVEWLVTPKLTFEGSHGISRYSDENRARRYSLALAHSIVNRRRFEASLTADFDHLRVHDDLDNGYYDPERYVQYGPGVLLAWQPRESASFELIGRIGWQEEKDSDSEPYHSLRASAEVPLSRSLSLHSEVETTNSNITSASGFEQNRWASYLTVPF